MEFNSVKINYRIDNSQTLTYSKGFINLTKLGENFTNICIN